ncbi:MAG: TetR/AcrR family transcriptional regulator [Pseudomonadota bacterium]
MSATTDTNDDTTLRKAGYHHGDLRAGLIEATRQLVEQNGPDGFSVSDACRLAGVSTAAPYKHFKNKGEMIVAVCVEGMERLKANMHSSVTDIPEGDPRRMMALGKEYINYALTEPACFRLKFGGFTDGMDNEALKAAGEAVFQTAMQEVSLCIGESIESPVVRQKAFMLWSFVHGLSFILEDADLADMGEGIDVDFVLADMARRVLSD